MQPFFPLRVRPSPLQLNMANADDPGGGVTRGARAQEEDICRRTTLYPMLDETLYPLEADELLYTPNVKIVKDGNYQPLQATEVIDGVLSSAALCQPLLAARETQFALATDAEAMRFKVCTAHPAVADMGA